MVENGFKEPDFEERLTENQQKKLEEDRIWNASALSMLHRAVADSTFPRIMRAVKAKDA